MFPKNFQGEKRNIIVYIIVLQHGARFPPPGKRASSSQVTLSRSSVPKTFEEGEHNKERESKIGGIQVQYRVAPAGQSKQAKALSYRVVHSFAVLDTKKTQKNIDM